MAKELYKVSDYRDVLILGLEPQDRTPHDYLRMMARIFAAFREIDPTKTMSTYLSGFRVSITNEPTQLKFEIEKGTAFVDDQFIAFSDDLIIRKDKANFVNDTDYWLVLYYQYSNQYPPSTPEFKFITEDNYDESCMLKLLKFKVTGVGTSVVAESYPQNLDDMYMANFKRLFETVESKVYNQADVIKYEYTIKPEKLYISNTNPDFSTKSGDIVFLDKTDGFYKPARACNKRYDKALGFYLYNSENNEHYIVTGGVFNFDTKYEIDVSNNILRNLEAGNTYYLLDNCSETDYDYKTEVAKSVAGKISSAFYPGQVRIGHAITNDTMVIDMDFSADLSVTNIMELTGLPQEFKDRFDIFFRYYKAVTKLENIQNLDQELTLLKNMLIDEQVTVRNDINTYSTSTATKENNYNNTLLYDKYDDPINPIPVGTAPESVQATYTKKVFTDTIKNLFDKSSETESYNSLQTSAVFKVSDIINYIKNNQTTLTSKISNIIANLNNIVSTLPSNPANGYKYFSNNNKLIINQDMQLSPFELWYVNASGDLVSNETLQSAPDFYLANTREYDYFTSTDITRYSVVRDNDLNSSGEPDTGNKLATVTTTVYLSTRSELAGHTASALTDINSTSYTISDTDDELPIWSTSQVITEFADNINIVVNYLNSIISYINNTVNGLDAIQLEFSKIGTQDINIVTITDATNNINTLINNYTNLLYESQGYKDSGNLNEVIANVLYYANILDSSNIVNGLKELLTNEIYNIPDAVYPPDTLFRIIKNEMSNNIIPYITDLNSIDNTQDIINYLRFFTNYSTERKDFIVTKYNAFKEYSDFYGILKTKELEDIILTKRIDLLNNQLSNILNTDILEANTTINELEGGLIAKANEEQSMHGLFALSDYERKIYNYTYITIRLRLKYKHRIAIINNIGIIDETLAELSQRPIPPYDLISKLQDSKDAYSSILTSIENEIQSLVLEYNRLRSDFGLEPIIIYDTEFSDGGIANPDLECFMVLE